MNIPFRVKTLTKTAKIPTQENGGDLWDLYADDFCLEYNADLANIDFNNHKVNHYKNAIIADNKAIIQPQGRILVKTGISIELPFRVFPGHYDVPLDEQENEWVYKYEPYMELEYFAVADIRPRSGLALKHGITVLNTPGTIDNSYRKEIGVILYNAGHEPYTITKGDKIAQMLIRPLYPSKMEIVDNINDTGRGGYGSTGK